MTNTNVIQRINVYYTLYRTMVQYYVDEGYTQDKASRKANLFAVKNTDEFFYTLSKLSEKL